MIQTRGAQRGRPPSSAKRNHQLSTYSPDLVHELIESFSQNNQDEDILISTDHKIEAKQQQLQKKSFILMGPGHSGKNCAVLWLFRNMQDSILWLDCRIWDTDSSFLNQLLVLLSQKLGKKLAKNLITDQINFKELSKIIKNQRKKLVIVLKNPDKLAQQLRPAVLYSILQWVNSSAADRHANQSQLTFVIITRNIGFIDSRQKRVRSRMTIPILFIARPNAQKLKQILLQRIQQVIWNNQKKEGTLQKLKKSLDQKQIQKKMTDQYQIKMYPISYYLKIMQLILAINIQTQQKFNGMNQKELNNCVVNGFQEFDIFITDHKNIARCFFSSIFISYLVSQYPEIIIMGLFRNRFLRQKNGNYSCPITLGQLIKDYDQFKKRAKLQDGGSSFLYTDPIMQSALKNLIDWNFMAFFRQSQKISISSRQITCRYGPQDIQYIYKTQQNLPNIIKTIYNDF